MKRKFYDFTTMVSSKRSPLDGARLTKCPKCGKLGEHKVHRDRGKAKEFHSVTHSGYLVVVAGLPMFSVEGSCNWTEEVNHPVNQAVGN